MKCHMSDVLVAAATENGGTLLTNEALIWELFLCIETTYTPSQDGGRRSKPAIDT